MTTYVANPDAPNPSLSTWVGFGAMCLGMFMAVLDIQVVATSLPAIQAALDMRPDQMSWLQASYLIAEVVAIPYGRAHASAWHAVAGSGFARHFHGGIGRLRLQPIFCGTYRVARGPGICWWIAHTSGVCRRLCSLSRSWPGARHGHRRRPCRAGTHRWAVRRWLDHPDLRLALAVPHQPRAWPGCDCRVGMAIAEGTTALRLARTLDYPALALMAAALAGLVIGLKEAPQQGWATWPAVALFAGSLVCGILFVRRTLRSRCPVVDLRALKDSNFALGCALSFILGIGLYGAVYLMPVFLAFVRVHDSLEIGETMMVTGAAQLIMAPIAVFLERRMSARVLTGAGFALFAFGLALSAFQTRATDFEEMVLPQILRGAAIMLCLLPPIRIALGRLSPEAVANASGLFNLMRNLGGAIGLALIDTVLYGRGPAIGEQLGQAIARGDVTAARTVGLPMDQFLAHIPGTDLQPATMAFVRAAVERQATVQAVNEAWALIAALSLAGALAVLLVRPASSSKPHTGS